MKIALWCVWIGLLAAHRWAQLQTSPARPSFDLASVKANTEDGQSDFVPRRSGERVLMHNTQLGSVVWYAYGIVNREQIS